MKIKEWIRKQFTFISVKYTFSLIWDVLKDKNNLILYLFLIVGIIIEPSIVAVFILVVMFLNRTYAQHIIRQLTNNKNN